VKCPKCGKKLKGKHMKKTVSIAVGTLIADGDLYICKNRHVWAWADPPKVNLAHA
jgi:hypothetical protein